MAANAGFDWLNQAAIKSDSDLPPPQVSFGVTPTSSSSSLNLVSQLSGSQINLPFSTGDSDGSETPLHVEETEEDISTPLQLRPDQLTQEEAKTYLRWYNDIVLTRGTRLIKLRDVFNFLSNFKLDKKVRLAIERIFRFCVSLNIGEFFALLRVISHCLNGIQPRRKLIAIPAPLLKPRSILAAPNRTKHPREEDEVFPESSQSSSKTNSILDLDSFTQFILTGENPHAPGKPQKKRRSKKVKFSDEVSVEPEFTESQVEPAKVDFSLPMDQLLKNVSKSSSGKSSRNQPSYTINDEEELREMQDEVNHFQNVKNVDSFSIHGTPANIPSVFFEDASGLKSPSPDVNQQNLLSPSNTGPIPGLLSPSHTGPVPFANSLLNPATTGQQNLPNGYLSPGTTGSPYEPRPLQPSMTGSLSSSMRQNDVFNSSDMRPNSASPTPQQNATSAMNKNDTNHLSVPSVGRVRASSSPIPFDPNRPPSIADQLQQQYDLKHQQAQQILEQYQQPTIPPVPLPHQRTASPVPPLPPPSRKPRQASGFTPQNSVSSRRPPALPPKVALDQRTSQHQIHQPQQPHNNNPYALSNQTTANGGSVYDRVLQDFTTNGRPLNGEIISAGLPDNASSPYTSDYNPGSTSDILGDLKALQSEVERLQHLQR